jgi:hypothetical protein
VQGSSGFGRLFAAYSSTFDICGMTRAFHREHPDAALASTPVLSTLLVNKATRCCPTSQAFYDRKRAEGKSHKQAILALARRRLDVLWALIRDQRTFEVPPPQRGLAVG